VKLGLEKTPMNSTLVRLLSATCLSGAVFAASPVLAQTAPAAPAAPAAQQDGGVIIVTGSSIRRRVETSALPLQVITPDDLRREGIASPEQLVAILSSNVSGVDNLAANADVTDNRSARGASFANLRGQGAAATLVLLNGRRVAAHGLSGGAVDVNQLPLAAMQRVDILKDGASAIYGTDAIGGVINFITKTDFEGLNLQAGTDVTEAGGGNIHRGSILAGYGDLDEQGFNIMGVVSYRMNDELLASERDFVDAFQPNRGLSVDTRGTPFGTIFPLGVGPYTTAGTLLGNAAANTPIIPGTTKNAAGGVNPLALPGGGGCNSIADMDDYFEQLWIAASTANTAGPDTARFACAWDTGEFASIQQEQETLNGLLRGVLRLGEHQLSAEYTASDATAYNRFSHIQLIPSATTITSPASTSLNFAYFRVPGVNDAVYDRIANALVAAFPADAALAARRAQNLPIAMRWRCLECGRREVTTNTVTNRAFLGADGPLPWDGWTYRAGISRAESESTSTLGKGYYYRNRLVVNGQQVNNGIVDVFNSGVINPFLRPGETQSAAGLAALQTASAEGVVLFGGGFNVTQIDASVSGPLFELPGGQMFAAVGFDLRREGWEFNGDRRAAAERANILGAPFDDGNALPNTERDVKAVFAELFLPLFENFELTIAARMDEYDGFGRTTNPKVNFRWAPTPVIAFRGSYNTGFRVPSFNQIYNAPTVTDLAIGAAVVDPLTCPALVVSATPGCEDVRNGGPVQEITGGNRDLGPEESEQYSLGVVLNFAQNMSVSVDWWQVETTGTIGALTRTQLYSVAEFFPERFLRNNTGRLVGIDRRLFNAGGNLMEGVEVGVRNNGELWGGRWSAALEGTYILNRQSKFLPNLPYSANQVGAWTRFADLTLEWRHNLSVTYTKGDWSGSLSQRHASSYLDNLTYAGLTSGAVAAPDYVRRVPSYTLYNTSLTYNGFEGFRVTAGVRNLLDTQPPFTLAYDSDTGSGSSWEPRVADPRGRSFTLQLEYAF
jgi:iron complex outermembrane recepter protein